MRMPLIAKLLGKDYSLVTHCVKLADNPLSEEEQQTIKAKYGHLSEYEIFIENTFLFTKTLNYLRDANDVYLAVGRSGKSYLTFS